MAEPFVNEFIEDYFAECDEHLATVRRVLLAIEESPADAPQSDAMSQLTRALHTLKGLSGMVGFADAEAVAHLMEDWLRVTTRAGTPVPTDALQGLFVGTRLLESCISTHRSGGSAPDIEPFRQRVRAVQQGVTSRAGDAAVVASESPLGRAIGGGARLYVFDFSPTRELAASGTTVETMRSRLGEIGTIVEATPRVLATGGVAFRFIVALHEGTQAPSPEYMEGVTAQAYTIPAPAPAAAVHVNEDAHLITTSVVRVELARLDELMRLVGELVISRGRIQDGIEKLDRRNRDVAAVEDANDVMERQLRDLREAIVHVRMVPVAEVFERARFAAREVARETGKQVVVSLHGQDTEVDKLIVEGMMEPLLHLVRNAVGHGIELPAVRVAAGKPAAGTLSLRAWTAGERIVMEVEDDGAGLDGNAVQQRAQQLGLKDASLIDIISAEGFSTRESADLTSGRGLGMNVVRQRVREMGGDISMTTTRGAGTRFTVRLPLTLMIVDAVMFQLDGHLMAVPQPGLIEVLQIEQQDITPFENNEVVTYRERVLPLFRLRALFGIAPAAQERSTKHVLVIGDEDTPIGIVVDRIIGQREIVVRSMTDPLVNVAGIAGATELSDGTVALIVDTTRLAESATGRS